MIYFYKLSLNLKKIKIFLLIIILDIHKLSILILLIKKSL